MTDRLRGAGIMLPFWSKIGMFVIEHTGIPKWLWKLLGQCTYRQIKTQRYVTN